MDDEEDDDKTILSLCEEILDKCCCSEAKTNQHLKVELLLFQKLPRSYCGDLFVWVE